MTTILTSKQPERPNGAVAGAILAHKADGANVQPIPRTEEPLWRCCQKHAPLEWIRPRYSRTISAGGLDPQQGASHRDGGVVGGGGQLRHNTELSHVSSETEETCVEAESAFSFSWRCDMSIPTFKQSLAPSIVSIGATTDPREGVASSAHAARNKGFARSSARIGVTASLVRLAAIVVWTFFGVHGTWTTTMLSWSKRRRVEQRVHVPGVVKQCLLAQASSISSICVHLHLLRTASRKLLPHLSRLPVYAERLSCHGPPKSL